MKAAIYVRVSTLLNQSSELLDTQTTCSKAGAKQTDTNPPHATTYKTSAQETPLDAAGCNNCDLEPREST